MSVTQGHYDRYYVGTVLCFAHIYLIYAQLNFVLSISSLKRKMHYYACLYVGYECEKWKNANVRLNNGLGPKLSSHHLAFIFFNIFNYYEAEVFLYTRIVHHEPQTSANHIGIYVYIMYIGERGELYQFLLEVKFLLRFNQENDR